MKGLINRLRETQSLEREEFKELLEIELQERSKPHQEREISNYLFEQAKEVRDSIFGDKVFKRGLIEISNYCKNNCYYCGIRSSNHSIGRYRLTKEQILDCCKTGYGLGFRTFVLQGGEDTYIADEEMANIIYSIKTIYPDCAITLSIGEKEKATYKRFFDAGADRYLLRHETSNVKHYEKLHPASMSWENRIRCLENLKAIGFQVGCGIMVGSPFQTIENIVEDICFIKDFSPHMVGIGPFISHHQTPFANEENGSVEQTLFILGIMRLLNPKVLLPSTTALGTLDPKGREKGILAGANVVMPNLSPISVRKNYELYDNKICTDEEAAECCELLEKRINAIGYRTVVERGDYKD